jgi:hypothetical protein
LRVEIAVAEVGEEFEGIEVGREGVAEDAEVFGRLDRAGLLVGEGLEGRPDGDVLDALARAAAGQRLPGK